MKTAKRIKYDNMKDINKIIFEKNNKSNISSEQNFNSLNNSKYDKE
jgi:hypothetical protein